MVIIITAPRKGYGCHQQVSLSELFEDMRSTTDEEFKRDLNLIITSNVRSFYNEVFLNYFPTEDSVFGLFKELNTVEHISEAINIFNSISLPISFKKFN